MKNRIELSSNLVEKLSNLPEQGMGYQIVKVLFKDGTVLENRMVINSTFLLILENENFSTFDIEDVEPSS